MSAIFPILYFVTPSDLHIYFEINFNDTNEACLLQMELYVMCAPKIRSFNITEFEKIMQHQNL